MALDKEIIIVAALLTVTLAIIVQNGFSNVAQNDLIVQQTKQTVENTNRNFNESKTDTIALLKQFENDQQAIPKQNHDILQNISKIISAERNEDVQLDAKILKLEQNQNKSLR